MINLADWKPGSHIKVFLAGRPKSAGKTTFAMTAPGAKLVLQYDLGSPVVPPGIDPATIFFKTYPPAEPAIPYDKDEHIVTDRWQRPTNVGEAIIKDIEEVRNGFVRGGPIRLDGLELPLPDTIVLDGLTEMPLIVVDWILGVNKKFDADDFIGDGGKANYFKLWQKRLDILRTLFHSIIPLPANVILIAWETQELVASQPTGKVIPDIGGKLDNLTPGKVDASLRCFATFEGGKVNYKMQLQPDGVRDWIGIRGRYGLPKEVTVTMAKDRPLPWEVVFGKTP